MKSIYHILIIAVLCLVSTTVTAQFEQLTAPPGKTTGIPKDTETAIDCSCNYVGDYLNFLEILDQLRDEARLRRLREQEDALKTAIEGRLNKTYDNFNEAQRAFFKRRLIKNKDRNTLDKLSSRIKSSIKHFQETSDIQDHKRQVLTIRQNTTNLAQFGDLRVSENSLLKIKDMTPNQVESSLSSLESDLSSSRSSLGKQLRQQDGIRKIRKSEAFTARMIDDYVNHYNSFNYEDRIKAMTKYMIIANGPQIVDDKPPFVLRTDDIDYEEIAEQMAFLEGTPANIDIPTISDDEAKVLYSLSNMGTKIYSGVANKGSLLSVYRKQIQSQKYDEQWLDIARNTFTTMFIRDGYPAIIPNQFAATNGTPLLQDRNNREMALSFQAERPDLRGLGNFLSDVFAISNRPRAEGSIMRDMFIHNGLTVHKDIPNWQLGDIFDFVETPLTSGDYHIQINFEAGIGIQLLQSGQAIETILQNPTIAEAGALFANGENKEERLRFFITVTSLAEQLSLTTQQRDWLIANSTETRAINEHLIANQNSAQSIHETRLSILVDQSVTPWTTSSGQINNNSEFKYNATRVHTYPDGQQVTEFRLENGDFIARGDYADCDYCATSYLRTMYRSADSRFWFDIIVPDAISTSANPFDFVIDTFWDGAKLTGRYLIPVEDVAILLGGQDFDGQAANQYLAGGFLVVGLIPGGKLVKPIARIVRGTQAWELIIRVGDEAVVLGYKIVDGFVDFGSRSKLATILGKVIGEEAHHMIPWALRNNKVVQEAAYAGFHMSNEINGKLLKKFSSLTPDGIHANHPKYNDVVEHLLEKFKDDFPSFSPEQAADFLEGNLIPKLDGWIEAAKNSGLTLNEYFKQIIKPQLGI